MTTFNFSKGPKWLQLAAQEIGVREVGNNHGADIRRYINMAHCGVEGDPWCAIFANAMIEGSSLPGTRSASSQSFAHQPNLFRKMTEPALGAIVVYWRGSKQSGLGHVGFYCGERASYIYTLGGNEGDMVQIEPFPIVANSFGLVGFYWPTRATAIAQPGRVIVPAGTPFHTVKVT